MIGTSLPAQGESVSPRERRYGSVGSRRNGGMWRFREHVITGVPPRARGGGVVRIWRVARRGWGGETGVTMERLRLGCPPSKC